MKEINRLERIGVLKRQSSSHWASPTFIIPKKDITVWTITDFRELNKRIVRRPYPIPKISTTLQELEGFTYAMALDFNMGYYTIRLNPRATKMFTIIFPWGKYSYLRLPIGFSGSVDIFQVEIMDLVEALEYVRAYIDNLLVITRGTLEVLEDHLDKLREVLRTSGLKVNAAKSFLCTHKIEYLGYVLTREGVISPTKKGTGNTCVKPAQQRERATALPWHGTILP